MRPVAAFRAASLAASLALAPGAASAEDMVPLADAVEAGAAAPYPFVRCASFFAGLIVYTGANEGVFQLSPETVDRIDAFGRAFVSRAVVMTMDVGFSEDKAITMVRNEGERVAKLYEAMFVDTHAKTGGIFDDAGLVESDLAFCGALMESYEE